MRGTDMLVLYSRQTCMSAVKSIPNDLLRSVLGDDAGLQLGKSRLRAVSSAEWSVSFRLRKTRSSQTSQPRLATIESCWCVLRGWLTSGWVRLCRESGFQSWWLRERLALQHKTAPTKSPGVLWGKTDPDDRARSARERGAEARWDHPAGPALSDQQALRGLGKDRRETVPEPAAAVQRAGARSCVAPLLSGCYSWGDGLSRRECRTCCHKCERHLMLPRLPRAVHVLEAAMARAHPVDGKQRRVWSEEDFPLRSDSLVRILQGRGGVLKDLGARPRRLEKHNALHSHWCAAT